MKFSINARTTKLGMQRISIYPDDCYSETKSLLFNFKSNRLTQRRGTILRELFDIFDRPIAPPTLYELCEDVRDYKYACPSGQYIYLAPFPTVWSDDTSFYDLSRRMTAINNKNKSRLTT